MAYGKATKKLLRTAQSLANLAQKRNQKAKRNELLGQH